MTWKDKSVSYDSSGETLKSVLGDVVLRWNGVERVERKRKKDWDKIEDLMDRFIPGGRIEWSEVDEIEFVNDHLVFPHVDILIESEGFLRERKIFFFKRNDHDNFDRVEKFYRKFQKFWKSYMESDKRRYKKYSFEDSSKKD